MTSNARLNLKIVKWSPGKRSTIVERFLKRPAVEAAAEKAAFKVLEAVKKEGDKAVARYAREFDGAKFGPSKFKVSAEERKKARDRVDQTFKQAAREAHERVSRFARAGLRKDWQISSPKGGMLGEQYVPLDRVGAYVPGGTAPLVSTAIMTVTLAKVAGVPEIVACSPAHPSGEMDPYILYALDLAGATEIYRIGGIQSIGAMAYGTRTLPKVQKIVGPGGPYVTAAKRQVYGEVALDMIAGPSELAVLADRTASPAYIAADLLSQAEHGTGSEKILLVTNDTGLAEAVREELLRQTGELTRQETVQDVLRNGTLLAVVDTLDIGMDLCNRFAPEHFELLVDQPRTWLKKVRSAGAVFVGPWTPEVAGDFVAGPSHVLPTGGAARMFSGLTVDDFRRRTSVISFTRADLKDALPVIQAFGRVEGLDAHTRSAEIRF